MKASKPRSRKFVILLVLVGAAVSGGVAGTFLSFTRDLPQIRSLESFTPSAITRVYSADDVLLAEFYVKRRDPVPISDIPSYLKEALIATEDRNFYHHSGIDIRGILRAMVKDIEARDFAQGASTITQQLAKTLFLTDRKTLTRKIKEVILAFQLERRYTKDEILDLYLNQVYLGSGAYGVQEAARIYFGKSVKDLDLSQCAMIAGLPQLPSRYSPLVNPGLALKRRNLVLKQMHEIGMIGEAAYRRALSQPVLEHPPPAARPTKAPYFVNYIKNSLEERLGDATLYKGGLSIYTTLSYRLQKAADAAVKTGLRDLSDQMRARGISHPDPQCALVSLDVSTGGILAMVGGRNFGKSPYNRAVMALRQPGSAFKPIVYGYAVTQGFSQNKLLLDAPVVFRGAENGKDWEPENYERTYRGEMTLREALAVSENIPAVRLLDMLGPSSVIRFAHQLGITAPLAPNLSLALGSSGVHLLNLTAAYRVFADGGEMSEPFGVTEIVGHSGRVLWRARPAMHLVMSPESAAITTDMLRAVVQAGTGRSALSLGRPVAGKTGTTDQFKDAWFVGYSPSIATGVWVGQDGSESLGKGETGARAALPIWIAFMEKALATRPYQDFSAPVGTVRVAINPNTGKRVAADAPGAVHALFRNGSEPQ